MRTITSLLVLVASLVLCATAAAEDLSPQWLVRQDIAVAAGYWRERPDPCRSYAVETGPTPFLAETELGSCSQRWNASLWQLFVTALHEPPSQNRTLDLRWSCVLAVHEFGHTVGLSDESDEPYGVMYRDSGPNGPVPLGCRRLFPMPHLSSTL